MGLCGSLLNELLWDWPKGLKCQYRCTLTEQSLEVTITLLDAILKYPTPMMLRMTKESVIYVLKLTVQFLQSFPVDKNFANSFRIFFNKTVLVYLQTHVKICDLWNVNWMLQYVYEPVLNNNS